LGTEAAKRCIKAYIRIQQPFYETSGKHAAAEKEDIKPSETNGTWWHESLRTLASIQEYVTAVFLHPTLKPIIDLLI
jgi:hypothetical protein